ncbi:MAG: hypothetical protein K2H85_07480 [Allobaculum sp.]|nr:hypothetical protein [Allobaculum sp.]
MPQDSIIKGAQTKITPQELATSAAKFRTELLKLPILALGPALSYFTVRSGIRNSETVGQLSGSMEIGPHDPYRVDNEDVAIAGRTLYTYFGSAVKRFDPLTVLQSIYGSSITQGDGLKNVPITVQLLSFLAAKIGKGFALHLFDAIRNEKGNTTKDLFNGIDTITANEIKAGAISVDNGNLFEFSETIDSTNAVDMLVSFCRAASDELLGCEDGADSKGSGLNLLVPRSIVYAYRDDYKATTGHSPIYDKFNQTVIEGFDNIRLVPFAGKANSPFIQLSTKQNMLIGTDQMSGLENISVEKHHEFLISFIATMFFGTDYESIAAERLLVGKLKTAAGA